MPDFDSPDRSIGSQAGRPQLIAVTGAGRGIGQELVRGLAQRGYKVAAISRGFSEGEGGDGIWNFGLDVSDHENCAVVFRRIAEMLGPVDGLIANAAIYRKGWFLDQSAEEFAAHFRTNVEGVANCIREVLPSMLERNCGRIAVLGSLADINPAPGSIAYSSSKGALHSLVRGIANEIDPERYPNVMINEFNPGATRTSMSKHGNDPKDILGRLLPLIEAPSGGASGRIFAEGREIHLNESWKGAIRRKLLGNRH